MLLIKLKKYLGWKEIILRQTLLSLYYPKVKINNEKKIYEIIYLLFLFYSINSLIYLLIWLKLDFRLILLKY